jgi:hypothetical protein
MRIYEAIVKGREGIGRQGGLRRIGRNTGLMLALRDSAMTKPVRTRN